MIDHTKQEYIAPSFIGKIYVVLGDLDRAFARLDKAEKARDAFALSIAVQPEYDRIRSDPRYKELLEKTGLLP